MKNLITIIISTIVAILPISAFAHVGHVEQMAGHTHALSELVLLSSIPAIALIAIVALLIVRSKNNG